MTTLRTHRIPPGASVETPFPQPFLDVSPTELGPIQETARHTGFIGTLERKPPPPVIILDATGRRNVERCMEGFSGRRSSVNAIHQWASLGNRLRRELITRSEDELKKAIHPKLECLSKERPKVDAELLTTGSYSKFLRSARIREGSWSHVTPARQSTEDGATFIYEESRTGYTPTPEESDLATVYARCGASTGADQEVQRVLARARATILAEASEQIRHTFSLLGPTTAHDRSS